MIRLDPIRPGRTPTKAPPTSRTAPPDPLASALPLAQGAYYALTGAWALLHLRSFMWATGHKVDPWLVRTVGVLVTAIGAALMLEGLRERRRTTHERALASPVPEHLRTGSSSADAAPRPQRVSPPAPPRATERISSAPPPQLDDPLVALAVASAAGLAAIDLVYVARRRIRPIYLLDAVAQAGLAAAWLMRTSRAPRRSIA